MAAILSTNTITIDPAKIVRNHVALATNPVAFAALLGYSELDQWQRALLLSTEQKVILNCCRQSGKSTLTAILALHHALYNPGALVLVASAGSRQAGEFFHKVTGFYQDLGRPVPSDAENKHTLELRNKSRIVSLPCSGQTIRGFSAPSLIVIDEAAQVPSPVYDDALTPMLAASEGRLILLSTPWGRSGFFYREWREGNEWLKLKITAEECPRISKKWLADRRAFMLDWKFKQEYMCEFGENAAGVFSIEEWENAFDPSVKPLFNENGELDVPIPDKPFKRGMIDALGWEL